jgi:hypothetical protein
MIVELAQVAPGGFATSAIGDQEIRSGQGNQRERDRSSEVAETAY